MYQDPKRIRKHRVSLNLDDYEAAVINALVDYTGTDRASLLRQMLIAQAEAALLPTPPSMAGGAPLSEAHIRTF
ncbi:hypothetical protein [Marinobacter nauticus]|uniref:hypothetical protein n=1 Tax=Marinobacter nauticus TaxID=2743 RepID=UPI001C99C540|nr:hypothetical protein [Marinobacter nauticus]MBY5938032.1 hypothetical protein [Marinobacter nauticus]MBY5955261.1 hypothetical protein [Marinobacter nauticus]MBY6009052.1 hypothetical protein [Marinobacter nauticus]